GRGIRQMPLFEASTVSHAEESAHAGIARHRSAGCLLQKPCPLPTWCPLGDNIPTTIVDVDRLEIGIGKVNVARDKILALRTIFHFFISPAATNQYGEARQWLFGVKDRGKTKLVAGDVLIVA